MDEGKLLAECLKNTVQGALLSNKIIVDIDSQIEKFQPHISDTTKPILTTFLENSRSSTQLLIEITTLLALKVELSQIVKISKNHEKGGLEAILEHSNALINYHQFSLFIVSTFLISTELHNLLFGIADKPEATRAEITKEAAKAGYNYLKGLAKRVILVEEVEEALELMKELEELNSRLELSKLEITLQNISSLDREIETFKLAAQGISNLREYLNTIFDEVNKFIDKINSKT